MADKIANVIGSLIVVGAITATVYQGRQTAAIVSAGGGALAGSLRAAEGLPA